MRRTGQQSGCPYCSGHRLTAENSFAGRYPELAAQWHPTKNAEKKPTDFWCASSFSAWWQCPNDSSHTWKSKIRSRAQNPELGCPICSRVAYSVKIRRPLEETHPQLLKEWHARKVWWRCLANPSHEWESTVRNRAIRGNGCPFCAGQYADKTNSLAALYPQLAAEWHPSKNGKLTPDNVTCGSAKKVWWRCAKNSFPSF